MPTPIAVRDNYHLGAVPEAYKAGWLRAQLAGIARSLWYHTSRTVLGNTTVVGADFLILVDATNGPFSVTFPPAHQMQFAYITVKKIDSGSGAPNTVTLVGTFDNDVNPVLNQPFESMTVFSDGLAWYTLATV